MFQKKGLGLVSVSISKILGQVSVSVLSGLGNVLVSVGVVFTTTLVYGVFFLVVLALVVKGPPSPSYGLLYCMLAVLLCLLGAHSG